MKTVVLIFVASIVLAACQPPTNDQDQRLRAENFVLKQQVDSLSRIIEETERPIEGDTLVKESSAGQAAQANPRSTFAGKHNLTIQWVSWEKPGSVMITRLDDTWHTIGGQQRDQSGNYLKINGKIRMINARELEFDGRIETKIESINAGEPCFRDGKRVFKATGTRKYWRMQDMINCDGGTTDYVDIYF